MKTKILLALTLGSFFLRGALFGDFAKPKSLESEVERFNRSVQGSPVGREQPPLTADEVIASIRYGLSDSSLKIPDEAKENLHHSVKQDLLPAGATLSHEPVLLSRGPFLFTTWRVNLLVRFEDGTERIIPIRNRTISSRELTPEEHAFFNDLEKEKVRAENRILILDNQGGHSHPGRKLELYTDGRIRETLYTDAVGNERENTGTFHLDGDTLTIRLGVATERLIRTPQGEQVFWIHESKVPELSKADGWERRSLRTKNER